MKRPARLLTLLFSFITAIITTAPVLANGNGEPTIVYLIRHGEKLGADVAEDPKDPYLSEEGLERASEVARLLGEAEVSRIYSTNYHRTRQTVQPLAERLGLEIQSYDPGNLGAFAKSLRSSPGRVVVSGHSNTTPALVELLGGDPGPPIVEATEYDRLYILIIDGDRTSTTVLRYGAPSPK